MTVVTAKKKPWRPRRTHWVELIDDWTPEEAEIVGRVVIAFNQLEHVLYVTQTRMKAIRWQVHWTKQGEKMPFDQKTQMLRTIHTQEYGKPIGHKWDKLLLEAEDIAKERNSIVHSLWGRRNGKRERRRKGRALPITPRKWAKLLERIQFIRDTFEREFWKDPRPTNVKLPRRPKP